MKKSSKIIADMKKKGIFESCIKSNFYVRHYSNTGTKLQRGRTGESPAVISMLDIDSVHSDPLLFISPNSFKMCTKNDECATAQSKSVLAYTINSKVTSRALALLNPISYGS